MYQPTTTEVNSLWGNLTPDNQPYFKMAKNILSNVNAYFTYGPTPKGWGCHSKPNGTTIYPIVVVDSVPTCTCAEYKTTPMKSPRPHGNFVPHCRHTLAWAGYRTILAEQSRWLNSQAPGYITMYPIQGIVQPKHPFAMWQFANWLAQREERREQENPCTTAATTSRSKRITWHPSQPSKLSTGWPATQLTPPLPQ